MADLPETIGKYKIVSEIARGGMGIVYKAIHPSLKRHVIIKKLSIRGNNSIKERFKREAQILLDLNNPNIVHLFDYFTEGPYHYIVLEFVDGMSLDTLLKKQIMLSPQTSMLIFRDALRALKFAHDNGVVHRDIKPGNILISRHGDIKLADFGIASSEREEEDTSLTQSGVTLGTPSYMPPEQFDDSHSVDKRADIYAMGIMLYEMVTGTKPFAGNFAPETIAKIQKGKYIPPEKINKDIPKVICKLIKKMTRVKAAKRYQDIEPILKIVDKYLKKYDTEEIRTSIETSLVTKDYQEPVFQERNKFFKKILGITITLLVFAGFVYFSWMQGYIHKTVLRSFYTPVTLSIKMPKIASIESDLPIKAFFFENDNKDIPEIENARRTFFHHDGKYVIKPVYLKPGEYRVKVVTGSYVWWKAITIEKENFNLNLDFLNQGTRPLAVQVSAIDSETENPLNAEYKVLINGKWLPLEENKNLLTSGSIVKIKIEAENYESEEYSLKIEWYQDTLYINSKLNKKNQ